MRPLHMQVQACMQSLLDDNASRLFKYLIACHLLSWLMSAAEDIAIWG